MWFWLSLIALLCWSGSDLFSKIGCQSETDKYSHLKMVTAVGVVMGLHAAYEIFIGGTQVTWEIIWTYLPVSLLYISSMAMGYIGLRYIELSISSPICNSSGALVAVLCLITGGMGELVPAQLVATALVCVGVVGLGIVEAHEDEDLRRKRQEAANRRYAKSALALLLPIIYCILDAAGTFADSRVLDKLSARGVTFEIRHCAASAAMLNYPCTHLDMVRPGIALYGHYPAPGMEYTCPLLPVMTLKTRVAAVRDLPAGTCVSYGRTATLARDSRLAVLPVGYGDGYFRLFSNGQPVAIRGKKAPVVGRVCMDLTMVDVTDIPGVIPGDEAVLYGDAAPVEDGADRAGTIQYELLCDVSPRVPRVYLD